MSEDCLYLNIFVLGNNVMNMSELYLVIMFIYGGSYIFGIIVCYIIFGEVLFCWGVVLVII